MNARVISLQIRTEKHGAPMPVAEGIGRVDGGIEGDVHAQRTTRAVLVIDRSTLEALDLRPGDLREEITIEGLPDVTNLPPDTEVRIGGVTLRVNGPCEPCTHIGELLARYRHEVETTEPLAFGVWAHVERAGTVRRGDDVVVEDPA